MFIFQIAINTDCILEPDIPHARCRKRTPITRATSLIPITRRTKARPTTKRTKWIPTTPRMRLVVRMALVDNRYSERGFSISELVIVFNKNSNQIVWLWLCETCLRVVILMHNTFIRLNTLWLLHAKYYLLSVEKKIPALTIFHILQSNDIKRWLFVFIFLHLHYNNYCSFTSPGTQLWRFWPLFCYVCIKIRNKSVQSVYTNGFVRSELRLLRTWFLNSIVQAHVHTDIVVVNFFFKWK